MVVSARIVYLWFPFESWVHIALTEASVVGDKTDPGGQKQKEIYSREMCTLTSARKTLRTSLIMGAPRNASHLASCFMEQKLWWINSSVCSSFFYHFSQDWKSGGRIHFVWLGLCLFQSDHPPGPVPLGEKLLPDAASRCVAMRREGAVWDREEQQRSLLSLLSGAFSWFHD